MVNVSRTTRTDLEEKVRLMEREMGLPAKTYHVTGQAGGNGRVYAVARNVQGGGEHRLFFRYSQPIVKVSAALDGALGILDEQARMRTGDLR